MDFLLVTVLCLVILVEYNAQPAGNFNFACSEGEEYHMCKSPCEPTCDSIRRGVESNCSKPCVAGCFCVKGLVRANDSTCVLPAECTRPVCRENEEYQECGSPCALNCSNLNSPMFCTKPCHEGCFCKQNFVRDLKGKCVHPRNCAVAGNQQCPPNEIYANCINFCSSCFESERCITAYCTPGCDCRPGYFRNYYGQCVTEEQCISERYALLQQCGVNEVFTNCINPCNDCVSRGRCEYGDDYCTQGCDCKQGFLRNADGICIPEWKCYRRCNENEVYLECGPSCRSTCENYRRLFHHPCKEECASGCFCDRNLVLGPSGRCIPLEYCPSERQPVCPTGEQYYVCVPTCRVTCDSYNEANVLCDTSCTKGCFCKEGLIRRKDGVCVLPKDCPERQPVCPTGEKYYVCVPTCRVTCDTYNEGNVLTTCDTSCTKGCFCKEGLIRRKDGVCVLPKDCPAKTLPCPPGEVLYQCLPTCRTTCRTLNSSDICSTECEPGCFCQPGFVRNNDGKCVRPTECPVPVKPTCPPGEIYYDCVPTCRNTCENLNSTKPCTEICRPGCFCRRRYVRRSDGVCIRQRNCPIVCGLNEEFRSCGSACPVTCENFPRRQVCTEECVRGCFCKTGFVLGPRRTCIPPRNCPVRATPPPCCTGFQGRRGGTDEDDEANATNPTPIPSTTVTPVVRNESSDSLNASAPASTDPATTDNNETIARTTPQSNAGNTSPLSAETTTVPSQTLAGNQSESTNPATNTAESSSTNVTVTDFITLASVAGTESENKTSGN